MSTQDKDRHKPELGHVDEVEQKLYSKNNRIKDYTRIGFQPEEQSGLRTSWKQKQPEEKNPDLLEDKKKKRQPLTLFAKILIVSFLFFIFSALAAYLVYTLNANQVSYDAVNLSVLGPNSVAAGEELSFDITVTNNNPVPVVLSDVVVNYPSGTVSADEEALALGQDIRAVEQVQPGQSETVKFSAVLYGAENDTKNISIAYQYRVPDSDNIFFKERVYQIQLVQSPVVVSVDHDTSYQSGDEVVIDVEVQSNANKVLRNLLLSIDYPFGFEFASSTMEGIDSSTYLIGSLEPGEVYAFEITGIIRGQDDEERTVRYILGSQHSERPGELGTVYTTTNSVLRLTRPPIWLTMMLNDSQNDTYIARPGDGISGVLGYTNTLATKLIDTEIYMTLSGSGYDRRSVEPVKGIYRSSNNTLVWTRTEDGSLAEIESAESGEYDWSLDVSDTATMAGVIENPEIVITTQAAATNFELGGNEQRVEGRVTKRIKVQTQPYINAYLLHSSGPFENTGPIRPIVGTNTTYTLVLEAGNSTNEVEEAIVTFTLPRYVSLRELMAPQEAEVSFDERSRVVSWDIGSLAPGTGYTTSDKTLYLSLEYEPSLEHVNRAPTLVERVSVTGIDTFTQTQVSDSASTLSTDLEQDPAFGFTSPQVREE